MTRGIEQPEKLRSDEAMLGGSITPLFALNAAAVLFFTGVTIAATLTRGSQLSSLRLWTLSGAVLVVLGLLAVRTRIRFRRHLTSLLAGAAIFVITIVHLLRGTAPSLYPTSGSVDVVHHYALVQYVFAGGQLPPATVVPGSTSLVSTDPSLAFLGEMVWYPFGAHVNAAVLAAVTNVQLLTAMTMFIYLVVALSATLLVEITRRLVKEIWPESTDAASTGAGVTAALVFLVVPRFAEGMLTADYFYAQVMGHYLVLFSILALLEFFVWGSRLALVMSGIASFLLAFTYPLFSLIPVAAVGLVMLVRYRLRWREWVALLPVTLGTALGLVLFLPGRLSNGVTIIANEGVFFPWTVSLLGGPIVVALLAVGFSVAVAVLARKHRVGVGLLLATVLMLVMQMGAMYLAKRALDIGSYYMMDKLFYLLFWLILPLAGLGAFFIAKALLPERLLAAPKAGGALTVGVLSVATLAVILWISPGQATPLINADSYAVAEWARSEIGGQGQFAMAEGGPQGYMLYVGVLNQPRNAYAYEVLVPEGDLLLQWLTTPEKSFLLTSNIDSLEAVIDKYDLVILRQQGAAAVLSRQG